MSAAILIFVLSHGQAQSQADGKSVSQGQPRSGTDGKSIFRFDTFGDEQLWTDTPQMQQVIKNVSPRTALSVGLKVDSDALPPAVINAIKAGQVNLDDPAVTVELLKLNAVIGVIGKAAGANDTLRQSALPVRYVIRRSITRSRRASAGVSMVGPIVR
jgi:hypothetical protein